MNTKGALEVLKKGMTTELWGRRFYEQALAHTAAATGQRVFRTLMDEEIKHLEILRGQYAAISGGKGWVSVEEAAALAASVKPTDIFPEAGAAERLVPPGASDEQALRLAMDFEARLDLYKARPARPRPQKRASGVLAKPRRCICFLDKTLEFLKRMGPGT